MIRLALTAGQKNKALTQLKMNIREASAPFFKDDELAFLLEDNGWDVRRTSYEALLRKAEDDSITLPSGLSVPNNRKYWLGLAKRYRDNASGTLGRCDDAH